MHPDTIARRVREISGEPEPSVPNGACKGWVSLRNPERLTTRATFAALAGVAPIPASSGQRTRHRLSRGGNRHANAALHRIVLLRMRHRECVGRARNRTVPDHSICIDPRRTPEPDAELTPSR
uniref:transposase n=1 Tax=Agromyces bauzanensis TaxID=1308924 RepID=UPI0016675220